MKKYLLLIAGHVFLSATAFAQDGTPDNTFDGDGNIQVVAAGGLYNPPNLPRTVLLQPDGKIVTCAAVLNGANYDVFIFRFNSNGTPDNTFDGDGRAITPVTVNDYVFRLALQADGKIVAAGYTADAAGNNRDMIVIRYNTDGSLDGSFDGDGIVVTNISGEDFAFALVVQPDDKIVIAGASNYTTGNTSNTTLVRYNTNGSLDNTFGTGGIAIFTGITNLDYAWDMEIQGDGKLVCLGFERHQAAPDRYRAVLVRFHTNGTPDNSFDGDGLATFGPFAFPFLDVRLYAITIQSDGKIAATGYTFNGGSNAYIIARFNSNGTPDNTIDGVGYRIVGTGLDRNLYDIIQQSDGKLLAAGSLGGGEFLLHKFNANGTDDVSFNSTGWNSYNLGSGTVAAQGIALQPNNNILMTGLAQNGAVYNLGMFRINNSAGGALPVSLTNFTAGKHGNAVMMHWTTATEINNHGFAIQRSHTGRDYQTIGFVAGTGNSNTPTGYSFTDRSPVKGDNFYRLQQTDIDGHYTLSAVRKINFDAGISFSIYPNPVVSTLQLQLNDIAKEVVITDMQGRSVWQQKTGTALTIMIPVNKLSKGTYNVQVTGRGGERWSLSFIKE